MTAVVRTRQGSWATFVSPMPGIRSRTDPMEARRFFIRRGDRGWVFGRDNTPFATYPTKEAALKLADRFLERHPEAVLMVEHEVAPKPAAHR